MNLTVRSPCQLHNESFIFSHPMKEPFPRHIEVALALPLHKTYTYLLPDALMKEVVPGKRVLVPLGRRRVTGYALAYTRPDDSLSLKECLAVLDERPLFPASMVPFFRWIADYYLHPLGETIQSALPGGLTVKETTRVMITKRGQSVLQQGAASSQELMILAALGSKGLTVRSLEKRLGGQVIRAILKVMVRSGWIKETTGLAGGRTRFKMERFVAPATEPVDRSKLRESHCSVVDLLVRHGEMRISELKKKLPQAGRLITPMAKAGVVTVVQKPIYRDPFGEWIVPDAPPVLTDEQQQAYHQASEALGNGFCTFLLAGVTGSGKTEVYLRLAAKAMEKGFAVIVLVPEIALTSQMENRFRARFGDRIALLHSGLSNGERYDQWQRILKHETTIAMGARSAIFAPFDQPVVCIVDEEHDPSYKQAHRFRYHARDLAVVRAKLSGGMALLGSATPSLESYQNVLTGKFRSLHLTRRVEQRPLPTIIPVDLRKQRDQRGAGRFVSPALRKAMAEVLERGEQVLLFLNRRGFATLPVCAACGESLRCEHCDITLTLHKAARLYKCHYCGFQRPASATCNTCGSDNIKRLGLGTEKLEEAIRSLFPEARIARMDSDTTRRKGALIKLLKALRERSLDVLIGTQIVAKGHDFPHITLVGIICADLSLNFPDFRASERTFQLLAQVAGRAGRGSSPGQVILQTYTPDHFSIKAARNQDFKRFFRAEIEFRRDLNYPPFARMIQLRIAGRDAQRTMAHATRLGTLCQEILAADAEMARYIEILGPIEAPLSRIADQFRWQILLKGLKVVPLHGLVRRLQSCCPRDLNPHDIRVAVDVDPVFML